MFEDLVDAFCIQLRMMGWWLYRTYNLIVKFQYIFKTYNIMRMVFGVLMYCMLCVVWCKCMCVFIFMFVFMCMLKFTY